MALTPASLPGRRRLDRARLAALLAAYLLAMACASVAVHWGLRIWRDAHEAAPAPLALPDWNALASTAARLFPAPHVVAASTRFRLWGVIGGGAKAGAALIGIDGRAPQAYPAGAMVIDGVRLVETGFGEAVLLRNGVREVLQTSPDAAPLAVPQGAPAGEAWPAEGRSVQYGGEAPNGEAWPAQGRQAQSGGESAAADAAALRHSLQRPN